MNKEIAPDVFIARTIVSSSSPVIKILNTTNKQVTLKNVKIETVDLSNFKIFNIVNETEERRQQLFKQLNMDIPPEVKTKMVDLCTEYADIFALKTDKITTNNFYQQKLRMTDNKPVYINNYRTPYVHKAEINQQVQKMLDHGIIEPSTAAYNSPELLVPKKAENGEKKWRLAIDFRQLNKKLVGDKFPLPRIEEILGQLGRAKWFSVIYLISGFHQIPLNEES